VGEGSPGSLDWSFGDDVAPGAPEPAAALSASSRMRGELAEGAVVAGRFVIEGVLGRGGMGVVYRAREPASGRAVALKLQSGRPSPARVERFRREGEVTATLRHPGIVRVYAGGLHDGRPYLAYELVVGETLDEVLPRLERRRRVEALRDVARALGVAHAAGVVHRDVKPANVLVDADGRCRVADFGLAAVEGAEALTRTGALVGTPAFMAPEQFRADAPAGPPADVWALGVMLYRALTDELPFSGDGIVELSSRIQEGDYRPPRAVDPTAPADLAAICAKALAVDAARRYPDGEALAVDLDDALAGRPVSASSWPQRVRRWRWRRSAGAAAPLAAVAAVVAIGLAVDSGSAGTDPESLAALAAACEESGERAALEAALAGPLDDVPADLAARAHLALAAAPGPDRAATWEARLEHARRARSLDPSRRGPAETAAAAALRALDRPAAAAEALLRARAAGEPPARLLDAAEAFLAAGLPARAEDAASAYLDARPADPPGLAALARARIGSGRIEAAEPLVRRYASLVPGADAQLLEADLAAAAGGALLPLLRDAVADWPDDPGPARALAERLLLAGRPVGAREVLARAAGRGLRSPALARLAAFLDGLLAEPPELAAGPGPWRAAACSWLLAEAAAALAVLERQDDPRRDPAPEAAVAAVADRARAALETVLTVAEPGSPSFGRAEAGLAALDVPGDPARPGRLERAAEAAPGDALATLLQAEAALGQGDGAGALAALEGSAGCPRWLAARRDRRRGEALLALGRPDEAIAALERAAGPWRDDPRALRLLVRAETAAGRDAARTRARLALVEGARRTEAAARLAAVNEVEDRRDQPPASLLPRYEEVLGLDPLEAEAHYYAAAITFLGGDRVAGLRRMVRAIGRRPILLESAGRAFHGLSFQGRQIELGELSLGGLAEELAFGDEHHDRLARLTLRVFAIEYEGRAEWVGPAASAADALCAEAPGDPVLLAYRGFLRLRGGRLAEAARDLDRALALAPGCGQVGFWRVLVAAARRAPRRELSERLAALERAPGEYDAWNETGWSFARYPELEPFRDLPGLAEHADKR